MNRVRTKPIPVKRSFGLACCRFNVEKDRMEMLFIKKRYTFYFVEFILGHYYVNDVVRLRYLFNRMSAEEKVEVESLNFSIMWYRVWLKDFSDLVNMNTKEFQNYIRCKNKFERSFLRDNGRRLKTLLNSSKNQDSMWEIPKGRKNNPQELDLNCAQRETFEEVGINIKNYRLLPELKTFDISYTNEKAKYINKYFICIEIENIPNSSKYKSPKKYLNYLDRRQVSEVTEVKWMSLDEIKFVDYTGRFYSLAQRVFKMLKKRYRLPKMTKLKMIT